MKTYFSFCGAVLLLIGIGGCLQHPAKLGRQIAGADRVVATNSGTRAGVMVAGDEAKKIAAAVASAKRDRNRYAAMFDGEVQFYSGTNFLDVIHLQDRSFRINGKQYSDNTGVLKAFYEGPVRDANEQRLSQ